MNKHTEENKAKAFELCPYTGWLNNCPVCARIAKALTEAEQRRDERLRLVLVDVCQLLDGWHADGTAWSEWDEDVRRRVAEELHRIYAADPEHIESPDCWCKPKLEADYTNEGGTQLWVHRDPEVEKIPES